MSATRFSVVIPTRERAATLRHALATCLDQDFDDYEVIVSDNYSSPETKAVVEVAASLKVRYFRTPRPVAMATNWDFALAQAQGEYVILIGDDDGLLPHALKELDGLIRHSQSRAVRWEAAYYTWPSFSLAGQGNYLRLPLGCGLWEAEALDVIREVIRFRDHYTSLPMLYNAAVHRDVLATLREKTGRVVGHPIPDVYSGFAVGAVSGRFLSTGVPMSVSGQSGSSNGIAVLFQRQLSSINKEFQDLNAQDGLLSDPWVPNLPVFPHVPVADAFLCAKRQVFPHLDVELDRRQFLAGCVGGLRVETEADWQAGLKLLRDSVQDDPALQAWFDQELAHKPFRTLPPPQLRSKQLGVDGESLHLDAASFGVRDVTGAVGLCERILNFRRNSVHYVSTDPEHRLESLRSLERQQIIEGLLQTCDERLELINRQHSRLMEFARGGPIKRAARWVKQALLKISPQRH